MSLNYFLQSEYVAFVQEVIYSHVIFSKKLTTISLSTMSESGYNGDVSNHEQAFTISQRALGPGRPNSPRNVSNR